MVETVFDEVQAFRLNTNDYDTACMWARKYYDAGRRFLVVYDEEIYFMSELPENRDCLTVYHCEDSLSGMLSTLQFLRNWSGD